MVQLALGTREGVVVYTGKPGAWRESHRALAGIDVVSLRFFPEDPDCLLVGSYGQGLFRVQDGADREEKLPFPMDYVRTIRFSPDDPATVYVGTEPAEIFRSQNGGDSWDSLGIRHLPQAAGWSLPYSPRAGALRSLILPAMDRFLILAGVEQGGFIRSRDSGTTWYLEDRQVDKDIHSLSIWPENPFRVFAATGEGVYRSVNQGVHWERLTEDYTRGVAVIPEDPSMVFAGPAAEVGEGGWIQVSRDAGESWEREMEGLPDPLEAMVQLFFAWEELPGRVFALLSSGELYESAIEPIHWQQIFADIGGIQTMSVHGAH